jgi:uncharacterized membrane protein (UPF0127 family)
MRQTKAERMHLRCAQALTASVLLLFSTALSFGGPPRQRITFLPSGVSVLAERAATPEERARGLMLRKSLGDSEAMIFCFEESSYLTFWMYHTLIPLTVIFLDEGLKIVDMQHMAPCLAKGADACPVYASRARARYAIEVNERFVGKHRIRMGDRVALGEVR